MFPPLDGLAAWYFSKGPVSWGKAPAKGKKQQGIAASIIAQAPFP
jgi:hypothetical protein